MTDPNGLPISPAPLSAEPSPRPPKSAGRSFVEDLLVTGAGTATSAGVAYGCFALEQRWHEAIYTWMADYVLPIGAVGCGFVAAVGYWIGSKLFNHRPTRLLLANIVLVSLGTFFAIYHLHYTHDTVDGVTADKLMSFPDYLLGVTSHMTYTTSGAGAVEAPVEMGRWGWGISALQVLGFCLGGWLVYGILTSATYCSDCSMYFKKQWRQATKWKDLAAMQQSYDATATLLNQQQFQPALDQHASQGEKRRLGVKGLLSMEVRRCPGCGNQQVLFSAHKRQGNQYPRIARSIVFTHEPIHRPAVVAAS